ncbi:hypothetical protein MARPO_0034s0067 [Marchantia polymorpha]|uniref:Uncharacterized protein n=1 Tax=Marchantia polymorpha TaxID=3197 RepID=A0A2R6X5V0_MARPO|nr:hypothetical protein MARPO_0034s0067 [Marchantia polymorpha]PTQ41482.1 hypothetical protein MARPO_0034s0067 [Marchantia polymorpha]|eukprot:PTQ41481.1 hypothetical protein MARPO_0034s0067 [Marchantia polymorpha]
MERALGASDISCCRRIGDLSFHLRKHSFLEPDETQQGRREQKLLKFQICVVEIEEGLLPQASCDVVVAMEKMDSGLFAGSRSFPRKEGAKVHESDVVSCTIQD